MCLQGIIKCGEIRQPAMQCNVVFLQAARQWLDGDQRVKATCGLELRASQLSFERTSLSTYYIQGGFSVKVWKTWNFFSLSPKCLLLFFVHFAGPKVHLARAKASTEGGGAQCLRNDGYQHNFVSDPLSEYKRLQLG